MTWARFIHYAICPNCQRQIRIEYVGTCCDVLWVSLGSDTIRIRVIGPCVEATPPSENVR